MDLDGVAYPYMGTTRHFHVVFNVRALDLNLCNILHTRQLQDGTIRQVLINSDQTPLTQETGRNLDHRIHFSTIV
jgi:hypothetical protein